MQHIAALPSRIFREIFGSQLRRNTTSGVLTTGINMLLLMVLYPLYLQYLGYEKYGLWLILTTVLGFAQLGNLGINPAVMKLVAEEHGRENLAGIRSYVTMAWIVLATTGSAVLLVILIFKSQIIVVFKLSGDNAELVSWLLPYVGILTVYIFLVQSLNATLSGLGRMDLSNYILTTGQIFAAVISVVLLWLGGGVKSLLIGNASSYVVVHIISLSFIHKQMKINFFRRDNWDMQRLKRLLSFGLTVFGSYVMSMLIDPFNKLMLSRYAGLANVPVYDIAYRGSMYVRGLMEIGLRAIMPEISRIGAAMTQQAHERIAAINRRAMKFIIICGVPLFTTLFTFATILLKFWLRKSFADALPSAFRVILIGAFLSLLGTPAFYTLMGLGKANYCFVASMIQGVVSAAITTAIALIRGKLSVLSVAFAVLIAMAIMNCYVLWQKHRTLQNRLLEIKSNNVVVRLEDITGFCGG
jgi:O-antigen/teichoic acid export membrane protein